MRHTFSMPEIPPPKYIQALVLIPSREKSLQILFMRNQLSDLLFPCSEGRETSCTSRSGCDRLPDCSPLRGRICRGGLSLLLSFTQRSCRKRAEQKEGKLSTPPPSQGISVLPVVSPVLYLLSSYKAINI